MMGPIFTLLEFAKLSSECASKGAHTQGTCCKPEDQEYVSKEMISYLGLERCRTDSQTKGLGKEENMKWKNSLSTGRGDRESAVCEVIQIQ